MRSWGSLCLHYEKKSDLWLSEAPSGHSRMNNFSKLQSLHTLARGAIEQLDWGAQNNSAPFDWNLDFFMKDNTQLNSPLIYLFSVYFLSIFFIFSITPISDIIIYELQPLSTNLAVSIYKQVNYVVFWNSIKLTYFFKSPRPIHGSFEKIFLLEIGQKQTSSFG